MGAAQRANPIKIGLMPLEPCPVYGYALSMVDHHCRHCAARVAAKSGGVENSRIIFVC